MALAGTLDDLVLDQMIPKLTDNSVIRVRDGREVPLFSEVNSYTADIFTRVSSTELTGTVESAVDSPTITGTGTLFTTELAVGDYLSIPGLSEVAIVLSITSDTSMTVCKCSMSYFRLTKKYYKNTTQISPSSAELNAPAITAATVATKITNLYIPNCKVIPEFVGDTASQLDGSGGRVGPKVQTSQDVKFTAELYSQSIDIVSALSPAWTVERAGPGDPGGLEEGTIRSFSFAPQVGALLDDSGVTVMIFRRGEKGYKTNLSGDPLYVLTIPRSSWSMVPGTREPTPDNSQVWDITAASAYETDGKSTLFHFGEIPVDAVGA
jgi:hypothetical protein